MTLRAIAAFLKRYSRFWDWHLFRWQFWLVCCGLVLVLKLVCGLFFGPAYFLFWWCRASPASAHSWVWLVADGLALATVYALVGGLAARLSMRRRNRKRRQ